MIRKPWFRDGMPWWAWIALGVARVAALVPFILTIVLAVWLARGGTKQLPGMAKRTAQQVHAIADSVFRR